MSSSVNPLVQLTGFVSLKYALIFVLQSILKHDQNKRKGRKNKKLKSLGNLVVPLLVPSTMDTSETSDVILASMLSINIAEISKIPPELRLVLISKFESMRNEIDLKRDGDVQDRKS